MCLINKKMTNIRKTNSVEKLKNALIELLLEKDYSEISVSDITKKAGVSRGTFYQHFLDKDDLATTIGEKTSQKSEIFYQKEISINKIRFLKV